MIETVTTNIFKVPEMSQFNAYCLKLVREQHGLSQTELAQKLGVKQAVLSKYERGVIEPPTEMQEKISQNLDYPVDFFEQEVDFISSGLVYHRKRSSLPAKIRDRIEAEARLRLMDVLLLTSSLDDCIADVIVSKGMSPEEVARQLRRQWEVPEGPISNLVDLLETHRIIIVPFDFKTDKLDGFYIRLESGLVCIVLNSNEAFSPDRNRFTLAHELGHVLLHNDILPSRDTEREADAFAAEFLMPEKMISSDLGMPITFEKLRDLKKKWKVSIGALIYRANKLDLISPFAYRRLWTYMSSCGFRKKEPNCELKREIPKLLSNMIETQGNRTENLPELLHLTQSVFAERYPQYTLK